MNNREERYRLFFAIWPSNEVRKSIVETLSAISTPVKGRVMQPQNLHITLHFIGQVTQSTKDCLHAAAQSVNTAGFQFNLDCLGYFHKAKILWIGCREMPVELTHLYDKLGAAIEPCGYQRDKRGYAPHVTLIRKCIKPEIAQPDVSIPWAVDEFVLVESVTHQQGVEYRVIEKYALA